MVLRCGDSRLKGGIEIKISSQMGTKCCDVLEYLCLPPGAAGSFTFASESSKKGTPRAEFLTLHSSSRNRALPPSSIKCVKEKVIKYF